MVDHFAKRIDLREELRLIMDNVGFRWIALRTKQLDKKCTQCLNRQPAQYEESPTDICMKCLSTGHLFVDKLVKSYSYQVSASREILTQIGRMATSSPIYILEHGAKPKEGDFICELDLDEKTGIPRQPFRIRSVYSIQDSLPLAGEGGRIEFFKTYCEEYNLEQGLSIW